MLKTEIINFFDSISNQNTDGLEHFLSESGKTEVFDRLAKIENSSLSKVQLNQLLSISGISGITHGFFRYYWLTSPNTHTYNVETIEDFDSVFLNCLEIISLEHLRWGLKRIYTDGLLYFGNITNGFNCLASKNEEELIAFFKKRSFKTEMIIKRGKTLDFEYINKEDRYLISEMACKTYESTFDSSENLKNFLIQNYNIAKSSGRSKLTVRELFEGNFEKEKYENSFQQLLFSADDILEDSISGSDDIDSKYQDIADRFISARKKALQNTRYYLSLVNDLDVYVATSMRTKKDFLDMANICEKIFKGKEIRGLNLRYFDPTISAAEGHEDKGMIECLMVHCSKVLIYISGFKESYGKDAEAAMALSSGKPVIFFCPDTAKAEFYKKFHPLTKLIDFSTGVANGAIVTFKVEEVIETLRRIFENGMEYYIIQEQKGYFKLVEKYTGSIVRIQTNNDLITKSFWNYFDKVIKLDKRS